MSEVKTIKVVRKNEPNPETGYVLINESDFDPKEHEKYTEPKSSAKAGDDKGGDAGKAGKSGDAKK